MSVLQIQNAFEVFFPNLEDENLIEFLDLAKGSV